jgi:hypothetical protein
MKLGFLSALALALPTLAACTAATDLGNQEESASDLSSAATPGGSAAIANPIVSVDCTYAWTAPYAWNVAPKPTLENPSTWLQYAQRYTLIPLATSTSLGGLVLNESFQDLALGEDYPVSNSRRTDGYVLSSKETPTTLDASVKFPDAAGESTLNLHLDLTGGSTIQGHWSNVERRNPNYTIRVDIPGTILDGAGKSPSPTGAGSVPQQVANGKHAYVCRAKRRDPSVAF